MSNNEVLNLQQVVVEALKRSAEVHFALEESGKEPIQKNQFGETTSRADWEAEETILDCLKALNIPIRVISEEHGITDIGSNLRYLGVMDGVDGIRCYQDGNGRYGTMVAIFEGINPKYEDYLVSAILEYPEGNLIMGARKQGAWMLKKDSIELAVSSGCNKLDHDKTRAYVDGYFDVNIETFAKRLQGFKNLVVGKPGAWGASSIYYADLVRGMADFVGECTTSFAH